jgi:large subunit ribosomal protein L15
LLESKGLIKDKTKLVKILGEGEIKAPITIQAHAFSKSASDKITKGGGKIELINA